MKKMSDEDYFEKEELELKMELWSSSDCPFTDEREEDNDKLIKCYKKMKAYCERRLSILKDERT